MGEVTIDDDNAFEIVDLGIQLEAVEDKIIVVMDSYKSGYECQTCGGEGKVKSTVVADAYKTCDECKGKGSLLVIPEISKSLPTVGTVVSLGPKTAWGSYIKHINNRDIAGLDLPNNGVIEITAKIIDRALEVQEKSILVRPGAKIIFQPHVGTLIPFKGNIRLKIMREHEPLAVIYGANVRTKDWMDFDVPFENRY